MHPSIQLIPADTIRSPSGVMHLIQGHADDTLCGRTPQRGWEYGKADTEGAPVTCLRCWRERRDHEQNARLGNYSATNGTDRCTNCDGTDWTNDHCTECGEEWSPEEE